MTIQIGENRAAQSLFRHHHLENAFCVLDHRDTHAVTLTRQKTSMAVASKKLNAEK